MSHNAYIWGVRIYLSTVETEDASIGLYTSTTSELRWIEAGVTLTTSPTTWCADMLLGGGIEAITQGADLRRRGGRASIDGTTVRVQNATRLAVTLADAGVTLTGSKAEIWEIEHNEDTGEVSRAVIFTGIVGRPQWTETELELPIETADNKRRAQLLTTINNDAGGSYPNADDNENGVAIPATFGELAKARMVRTAKSDTLLSNDTMIAAASPRPLYRFPVTAVTSNTQFTIQICTALSGLGGAALPSTTNLWVTVVDGTNVDVSRKVSAVAWNGGSYTNFKIDITVSDYFPASCSAATDATNTWVELREIVAGYALDVWKCKSLMDYAGTAEVTAPELYGYTSNSFVDTSTSEANQRVRTEEAGFTKLPNYEYTVDSATNNNAISIDAKHAKGSRVSEFECPLILPVTAVEQPDDATLENWGYTSSMVKVLKGLYSSDNVSNLTTTATVTPTSGFPDAIDADHTSYERARWTFVFSADDEASIIQAITFRFPTAPDEYNYDSAYLLVRAAYSWTQGATITDFRGPTIKVRTRRFTRKVLANSYDKKLYNDPDVDLVPTSFQLDNIPDFYSTVPRSSGNIYYYTTTYTNDYLTDATQYGYSVVPLDVTELKAGTIHEASLELGFEIQRRLAKVDSVQLTCDYYELAVAFVKNVNVAEAVYTNVRGRKFDNTWGTRKTAANLITTPVDAVEHIARLQNWSETGDNVNWGKAYAPSALIKTSGAGSFDDTALGAIGGTDVTAWRQKDIAIAGQIHSESDGWTDSALDTFLRMSWLVMYKDASGYECIKSLLGLEAPASPVTLDDIIGRIDPIEEPDAADVFTSPVVRYNYNYGSGKYDGQIQVTQPNAATFSAAYTPGLSSTAHNLSLTTHDNEVIWNLAAALYARFPQIEVPPSELSELPMVRDYTTALWYLYHWLQWMGKRRTGFTVPYSVGKSWVVGARIGLQLPHQTSSENIECIIESVTKDKGSNRVTVKVILLEDITL